MCGYFWHIPNWGPGPQPRHVPWLGIELAPLWFAGQHPSYTTCTHWATPARVKVYIFCTSKGSWQIYVSGKFCGQSYFTCTRYSQFFLSLDLHIFHRSLSYCPQGSWLCFLICWRKLGVAWALRISAFPSLWLVGEWIWLSVDPRKQPLILQVHKNKEIWPKWKNISKLQKRN